MDSGEFFEICQKKKRRRNSLSTTIDKQNDNSISEKNNIFMKDILKKTDFYCK